MASQLNPYLNFAGNAREAMEFYQSVFGGELTVSTFADFNAPVADDEAGLTMHAALVTDRLTLFASDTPSHMDYAPAAGFSVSLSGTDAETLRSYWNGLSDGATIGMPLAPAPWGDEFGQLVDKFGISWLVNITGAA